MEQNYLKKIIQRNARRPLLTSLVFIIIFLAASISESNLWSTLFFSLNEGSSAAAVQELYEEDKAYIQLKGADVYFLDYAIYDYSTINGVKASDEKLSQIYGIILYDDGYLLALLPDNYLDMSEEELSSVTAVASLESLDDSEYHREAYNQMVTALSDAYETDPAVIMENVPEICVTIPEDGRLTDQLVFAIIHLILLISLIVFLYQVLVILNYKASGFYKKLHKTGAAEDIEYSINRAVAEENYFYKSPFKSPAYTGLVTAKYTLGKVNQSLALHPTKDLIWVYLKLIKHKSYFITVSKTYQVLFYFKDVKTPLAINCKKEEAAAELIQKVTGNMSVMCEYSKELMKIYRNDYPTFLKLAAQRKAAGEESESTL